MQAAFRKGSAARALATALLVAATAIPAASGAGGNRVDELRSVNAQLESRSRSALLELYALESRLARARAELAAVRARADAVAAERARVRDRVVLATRTLALARRQLALRLRELYELGDADPIEILLGAASLDDAVTGLDGLRFAASRDDEIVSDVVSARRKLARLSLVLARRSAELRTVADAAARDAAALEGARAERAAYVERLAAQRRLNANAISALERQAQAARARAQRVASVASRAAPAPVEAAAPAAPAAGTATGARTLTVTATGYAIVGRTATGMETGWGVVAVDPSVIPLGTRITIPGYGEGVAADTGPAIQGARIDLWFPTRAEALAWGVRSVTITLH